MSKFNILIVYHNRLPRLRATNADALWAFARHSRHRCFYFNTASGPIPSWLLRVRFDIIIFHTLFVSEKWTASAFFAARDKVLALQKIDGVKICMAQDEFLHAEILCDFVRDFAIDHLLVLTPPIDWPNLYGRLEGSKVKIHQILAAYLEPRAIGEIRLLRHEIPQRTIDVGYRAWRAQPWAGRHGLLKFQLAEAARAAGTELGLKIDISTDTKDVFLGDDWYRFLLLCRSVVGVEGGASLNDPDGSIRDRTDAYVAEHPEADFDEIAAACFPRLDGNLHLQVITPRHLECCVTRTCQILVEGGYNGILKPDVHYIPVRKDLSDLREALRRSADPALRKRLTDRAYDDVVASARYSYPRFVEQVIALAAPASRPRPLWPTQWAAAIAAGPRRAMAREAKWPDPYAIQSPASPPPPPPPPPPSPQPLPRPAAPMNLPIDSVYLFMWPGWRQATRSNNWHYGHRWARLAPLVMLQPERAAGAGWCSEPEPRIDNVEILSIQQTNPFARPDFDEGLVQARQIISYMRQRGHQRPLLWSDNPYLAFAFGLVPGSLRVYHATENYFDFEMPNTDLADLKRSSIDLSDAILCCSTGVLKACREETGRTDLHLIPNGCDYDFYTSPQPAKGDWPERLRPLLEAGGRYAVFGGNINLRMDFPLLHRLAAEFPDLYFVYAGPVDWDWIKPVDRESWTALLERPNVIHLGPLDPDDLPLLYHLADIGIIPYRKLPFLVRNGLPLKALEMAASGLPVVSSLMEPLLEMPDAVEVVRSGNEFVARLRGASRRTRPAEAAARADAICREYDYERRFEQMLEIVLPLVPSDPPRLGRIDRIYERIGVDHALRDLPCAGDEPPPVIIKGHPLLRHIPPWAALYVPRPIKRAIKRCLGIEDASRPVNKGHPLLRHIPPWAAGCVPDPVKRTIKRYLGIAPAPAPE